MTGRVIRAVAGQFFVDAGGEVRVLGGRGKCKRLDKIVVGDLVEIGDSTVEEVLPRKNRLVRPSVANVDRILLVLAPLPEPDLMLADKLIIYADSLRIPVTVVLNKSDIGTKEWTTELFAEYGRVADQVVCVSATRRDGLNALKNNLHGFCVLVGQSAAGKSSLLNALGGREYMLTGEVGERSGRGRHTTRHAEIFACDGAWMIDTPGFSMLDGAELALNLDDADYYYAELFDKSAQCRYNRCTHTHEPDCAVKEAVQNGTINGARYQRYLKLRDELKDLKSYE